MGLPAKKLKKHNIFKELQENKKFKLINSVYVDEALEFINLLHPNNTGYFAFLTKQKDGTHQYMHENIDFNLLQNYMSLSDLYVSVNSFFIPLRQTKALRQLNAFWVDLDYYNIPKYKNKTAEEMAEILKNNGIFSSLEPSIICDSGHGMYVFWLIEDAPKQGLKLWQKIENRLVEQFKTYGADPNAKDAARVLRLPGSINTKTGRRAKILSDVEIIKRYTLKEMQSNILEELPYSKEEWNIIKLKRKNRKKEYQASKKKPQKPLKLMTIKNLNYNRMMDIKTLIKLRNGSMDGYRHTVLYMYSLFNSHCGNDADTILKDTIVLNNSLTNPLEDREIEDTVKTATNAYNHYLKMRETYKFGTSLIKHLRKNGCIIYSNLGIIDRLDIESKEMDHLQTIIDKNQKMKRDRKRKFEGYYKGLAEQGKKTKKEELEETRQKIKTLRQQGLRNKDIMQMLDITSTTYERHITYLKKNGFL